MLTDASAAAAVVAIVAETPCSRRLRPPATACDSLSSLSTGKAIGERLFAAGSCAMYHASDLISCRRLRAFALALSPLSHYQIEFLRQRACEGTSSERSNLIG